MPDSLLLLLALVANTVGLGWLALAIDAHWKQVHGGMPKTPVMTVSLRCLGAVGLLVSLVICLGVDHGSMASLVWVMALAGAALVVAFTLAWRPRWLGVLVPRARATRPAGRS